MTTKYFQLTREVISTDGSNTEIVKAMSSDPCKLLDYINAAYPRIVITDRVSQHVDDLKRGGTTHSVSLKIPEGYLWIELSKINFL